MKLIKHIENIILFIPRVIWVLLSIVLGKIAELILKERINILKSSIDYLADNNRTLKSNKLELQKKIDSYGLNSDRIKKIYENSTVCYLIFNKKTNELMILSNVHSYLNNILYNLYRLFSHDTKPVASIDFSHSYEYLDYLIVNDEKDYNKGYGSILLEFYLNLASSKQAKTISGKLPGDTDERKYKHLYYFYSKHGFEIEAYSTTKSSRIHRKLT